MGSSKTVLKLLLAGYAALPFTAIRRLSPPVIVALLLPSQVRQPVLGPVRDTVGGHLLRRSRHARCGAVSQRQRVFLLASAAFPRCWLLVSVSACRPPRQRLSPQPAAFHRLSLWCCCCHRRAGGAHRQCRHDSRSAARPLPSPRGISIASIWKRRV